MPAKTAHTGKPPPCETRLIPAQFPLEIRPIPAAFSEMSQLRGVPTAATLSSKLRHIRLSIDPAGHPIGCNPNQRAGDGVR